MYGKSVKEVMKKMRDKEKELNKEKKDNQGINYSEPLKVSMQRWFKTYKKTELKARSYDRVEHTINNQILKYDIANVQMQAITSDNIQKHINAIIEENYSYSTVKKTYEILNQFFNYVYIKNPIDNPMLITRKPTKNAMNVVEESLEIFDDDDIKLFEKEAKRTCNNGKPFYRLGWGLIAIMYTGLRVTEAIGLHWSDFNFDENYFNVYDNLSRVIDRSKGNDGRRENGTYYYKNLVTSTKTPAGYRKVYLNNKAKESFLKVKEIQQPKDDLELVFATKSGKPSMDRNLRRMLNSIQERANTKVQNSGLHLLRRTFVSLLVRNGVDKKIIAQNVGQEDTDMIEKIYYQLTEKEIIKPVEVINDMSKLTL